MSAPTPARPADKYHVARPQGRCVVTDQPIEPDQKFMAALRETAEGFERLDVSMEAWQNFDKSDLIGFWQTTMPHPEQPKKKLFVDDEVLRNLFERLQGTEEPSKQNFRFVLGLILMRKRMLIYESTRMEGDEEVWVVRLRGQDQMMDLLNPRLTEEQVGEVSQQLSEILNEEL